MTSFIMRIWTWIVSWSGGPQSPCKLRGSRNYPTVLNVIRSTSRARTSPLVAGNDLPLRVRGDVVHEFAAGRLVPVGK